MATHEALATGRVVADIEELLGLSELSEATNILATLVAVGCLDVRIAYRPGFAGLYHEKLGSFQDSADSVSFIGSANETRSAWSTAGNFESIEVFCSWHSLRDEERTAKHKRYLHDLVNNRVPGVEVLHFPEAARRKLFERAAASLDDLVRKPTATTGPSGLDRQPLPHQSEAIKSWLAAGQRGILQHATGSGKTFTSLLAMRDHAAKGLPCLVLVPSVLLQEQWRVEVERALPGAILLLAGGGHDRWREGAALKAHTSDIRFQEPRVTIATMATAASREFCAKLAGGAHLMVVADEVHQVGSPENSQFMRVRSGPRLGLSATPQRYGDPAGTQRIYDYFGAVLLPIVTLKDAIAAGRLVEYEYFPHGVTLAEHEVEGWRELTKRIGQSLSRNRESGPSEDAKKLIIKRARIAKKAERKIACAREVVANAFSEGQRWILYCEDVEHMSLMQAALSDAGLESTLYHSQMKHDARGTLDWFTSRGGILVAVRCLDEGIDIPNVSHALILASSQNPRQFVQRRGRILRVAPDKPHAVLHDILVMPVAEDDDPLQALSAEFARAVEFARDARNVDAYVRLVDLANEAGIDIAQQFPDWEGEGDD